MADDNIFDKKKIIDALRAKGIPDSEIAKLYGPLPKVNLTPINSAKNSAFRKKNAWKYDNKHIRDQLTEDIDPDYEPIEELRKKTKKKPAAKPRISKKKPKPKPVKNDWNAAAEARLKALYEAGYTTDEMAKEFKTTTDAITGKISRMRKSGWKGMVGTTHNPIPTPSSPAKPGAPKLSPTMKKLLAFTLERNFGIAGSYLSRKWGLSDKKIKGGAGGGADVTAAVIKSNQMIVSSLTKLDNTLKRGTSTLTKTLAIATAKMTDAVNNTIELIKKNQTSERIEGGNDTSVPTGSAGRGGGSTVGTLAALIGGGALAMLMMNSRAEASTNSNDQVSADEINNSITPNSENELREQGEMQKAGSDKITPEVEVKVKELTFEADDITFEADQFKFTTKGQSSGGASGGGPSSAPAGPTSGGGGGFFNGLADKLTGGGGGGSGGALNSLGDAMTGGGASKGGSGFFNGLVDKMLGRKSGGGGAGGSGSGGGGDATSTGGSGGGSSEQSGSLAEQRQRFAEEMKDPGVREMVRAMASAEEGGGGNNSDARKAVMETMMNRASAYKKSLADTVGNQKYYEPYQNGSYNQHLGKVRNDPEYAKQLDKEIDEVVSGSNYSNYATHNGSAGVAARARRDQSIGWTAPNGEVFSRKDLSTPEAIGHHGAGTKKIEGGWFQKTKAADDVAKQEKAAGVSNGGFNELDAKADEKGTGFGDGDKPLKRIMIDGSTSGRDLNNSQKENDSDDIKKDTETKERPSGKDERSDAGSSSASDSFQTTLLETSGPNHFRDFPMSDQGVGA